MKKKHVFAIAALTAIAAGATVYLLQWQKSRDRRKAFVANAGYETAYDVHYPITYKRNRGSQRNSSKPTKN